MSFGVLKELVLSWRARYDDAALRPPVPVAVGDPRSRGATLAATWVQLHRWCHEGTGDGRVPLLRPWLLPQVEQRFAVMALPAAPGVSALVESLACELDGSHRLRAAGGVWARRWLRLRVKVNDLCWWRRRRRDDPWDSGYAGTNLAALRRFAPRRPTLVIVEGQPAAAVQATLAALAPRAAAFRHPVRLLVVGAGLE